MIIKKSFTLFSKVLLLLMISVPVMAGSAQGISDYGLYSISGAIVVAVAALGGTIGQGLTASAALSGIARNPEAAGKIFVPMILCMALIESLVLFSLLISFIVIGNIS